MISFLPFFLPKSQYMELELASEGHQGAHEVGGVPKGGAHPRENGVGPLVFIFGEDFLLFFLRCSVDFRSFRELLFSAHKTTSWQFC